MVEKMRKRSGEWRPSAPNPRNDRAPNNQGFAHAVESVVEAAYRRGHLFGKRQMLMDVSSRRFWPLFALPLAPILSDISLPFSDFSHVR